MNPIHKIIQWRLDIFIKEFNIKLEGFVILEEEISKINMRIRQQLLSSNYITAAEIKRHKLDYEYYRMVIKNIIWKNIINYEYISENKNFDHCTLVTHFLYCNHIRKQKIGRTCYPKLLLTDILNESLFYDHYLTKTNLDHMLNLIINYFILISIISTNYIEFDISNLIKQYIYNIIIL